MHNNNINDGLHAVHDVTFHSIPIYNICDGLYNGDFISVSCELHSDCQVQVYDYSTQDPTNYFNCNPLSSIQDKIAPTIFVYSNK